MIKPALTDSYYRILIAYISKADEMYLIQAEKLGRQLVFDNVPPEDVAELHETAIKRLGREYPDVTIRETAKVVSAPLMELLMAYGLAFRAQTEERNKLMAQLKNHRDHLEELVEDIESFSYSVSHDLRAPIRAIGGFSKILTREYSHCLDREGKRLLGVIIDNTRYMGQLIDDMLTLSYLGRKKIEKTEIQVSALIKNVVEVITNGISEQEPQWEIHELPTAWGDVMMIRTVWMNLLSNAVKFTESTKNAKIEVGCKYEENEITYYVKDNGVGFDMEYADKLFEVFQRLHSSDEFSGTGVGLAIVHRIIKRHGGMVWAEGKVNQGATFYFTLPKKRKKYGE